MPASIGSFAFRKSGGFVIARARRLLARGADGTLIRKVGDAPYDPTHHRFNDGRCDRQGRFFAGYMNEARDASNAALVRLDPDFTQQSVLSGMMISNGLAWSPDGRTMYHADTPTRVIRAFDYDSATGTPRNPRVFASFTGKGERPDGGAVDSEGAYWSAFYGGGEVVRIAPGGRILARFAVPAMCPTMCAFGGVI